MRPDLTYLSFYCLIILLMTGCIHISEASLEVYESDKETYSPHLVIATLTPLPTWLAGQLEGELAAAFPDKPLTELLAATATVEASATPSASPTLLTVPASPSPQESPTIEISPSPSPDTLAEVSYTMQSGDSVWAVALEHGLELYSLLAYNGIKEPTEVYVGTTLRIPQGETRIAAMYAVATAFSQVTPIPTAIPSTSTPIPTATLIPTATPTATDTPIAQRIVWETSHTYQKLNNCAPASTSILLSHYGINTTQFEMAALQKPVSNDVNVTAEEVAESIRLLGLGAYVGYNGSTNLVIRLLANGFVVMTEEWMAYDGGVGHFRVVNGYDLSEKMLLYNDTFYGPNLWRSYDAFELAWEPFNNKFVVAYTPDQEAKLRSIIGINWDEANMYENLRIISQAQLQNNASNPYAWWGLGEALLRQGHAPEAIDAFEEALATNKLPWRYLWYRYGYFEALNRVERFQEVLEVTEAPLKQMGRSEDIRYYRAVAFYALGNTEQAKAELYQALNDNPRFKPASIFLEQLEGEGGE